MATVPSFNAYGINTGWGYHAQLNGSPQSPLTSQTYPGEPRDVVKLARSTLLKGQAYLNSVVSPVLIAGIANAEINCNGTG